MAEPGAVARHPHLAAPLAPGRVRVDLHLHTMWSGDSQTTPDELADAVRATGLDVLCVTDHGAVAGAQRLQASGELGCRVIVGQEVRTAAGEIIGLFLTKRLSFGLKPEEACEAIRAQGGISYVPHPFDELRHALSADVVGRLADAGLVDAVEVFNAKSSDGANRRAAQFAAERGLAGGAGSDSHEPSAIGAAFVEIPDFGDAPSFLAALRSATVRGHRYDAARAWRPRIVPSTSTS
jgi:predicted metal-dependent phosphoesterase TrpH